MPIAGYRANGVWSEHDGVQLIVTEKRYLTTTQGFYLYIFIDNTKVYRQMKNSMCSTIL